MSNTEKHHCFAEDAPPTALSDHERITHMICLRPIYVYGTFIAVPPTFFKLGRADTQFNPNETQIQENPTKQNSQDEIHSDSEQNNKMADDKPPYKKLAGHWMFTMDGRSCTDPGFSSYSNRH